MKTIKELIFGRRVQGEKLEPITFKVEHPKETLPFNEWAAYSKVSSRHNKNRY